VEIGQGGIGLADTASTLLPKLNDWLKHEGVSARVVVKGKDTLEIRMEAQDLFTEQFALKKRPVVKTHVSAQDIAPKRKPKPKVQAPKSGFNLHLIAHKDNMCDADLTRLHDMTQSYSFLSATRLDSKVWETTCHEVVWLASGFFSESHKWDKAWLAKTEQKGGGPAVVKGNFDSIPTALDTIKECLDYVEKAHENGGYWFPPLERGKIPRKSLASFLCSQTKAGTEWSPFCEVLWEMNKDVAIKSSLPKLAIAPAEQAIKDSPYLSGMPASSLATYWSGLKKFVDWYNLNRDMLMSKVDNRVRLADIGMAVTLVREWNASASGRVLPLTFIYPGNEKWFRFVQWCKTNRNVIIPDYRNNV
jgi:hypothetical protein